MITPSIPFQYTETELRLRYRVRELERATIEESEAHQAYLKAVGHVKDCENNVQEAFEELRKEQI